MIVIGIDCGLDGGVVAIHVEWGKLVKAVTPTLGTGKRAYDAASMRRLLRDEVGDFQEVRTAYLERAQAMPPHVQGRAQGNSSTFSTGFGFGMWQGLLAGLGIPFEIVSPQTWQKEMFSGVNRADTKAASALVAQRLRPDVDWRASQRCRKPHDGMTDAFCIAEYGRRRVLGTKSTQA